MTRLSLDITGELDIRLKTYLLKTYGRTHSWQQVVLKEALVAYLDAHEAPPITTTTVTPSPNEATAPPATTVESPPHEEVTAPPPTRPRPTRKTTTKPRKRLVADTQALARIKELWVAGIRKPAQVSREIDYHVNTTRDAMERMKAAGDLQ